MEADTLTPHLDSVLCLMRIAHAGFMLETIHYLKVMLQPVLGKYMIMIQGLQLEGGEISLREEKSALGRRNQLEGGENSSVCSTTARKQERIISFCLWTAGNVA